MITTTIYNMINDNNFDLIYKKYFLGSDGSDNDFSMIETFPDLVVTLQFSSDFPADVNTVLSKLINLVASSCFCLSNSALSDKICFFLFLAVFKSSSKL